MFAAVGYLLIAILEPDCGYAGHPVCYTNCSLGYGLHFAYSVIPLMVFMLALVPIQLHTPALLELPNIPCFNWFYGAIEEEEIQRDKDEPEPSKLGAATGEDATTAPDTEAVKEP